MKWSFHVEVRCDVIVDQQYFGVGLLKFAIFDLLLKNMFDYTLSRCTPLTKNFQKNVAYMPSLLLLVYMGS